MSQSIHISTARTKLNSGDPVDISVWKSDGSILELRNVISLRYSFYGGWRNVKILASGECRRVRDCCIFRVNGLLMFFSDLRTSQKIRIFAAYLTPLR